MMRWHYLCTRKVHESIIYALRKITRFSVAKATFLLLLIPIFSFGIFAVGFSTNFNLETDKTLLWTPYKSNILADGKWIKEESGFSKGTYPIHLVLHANGDNVLTKLAVDVLFQALEVFQSTDEWYHICFPGRPRLYKTYNMTDSITNSSKECDIQGVTNFFNDDYNTYIDTVSNDDDLIEAVSKDTHLQKGELHVVRHEDIFGNLQHEQIPGRGNILVGAELLKLRIGIPLKEARSSFEETVITRLLGFRQSLQARSSSSFRLEILSMYSYDKETEEAIRADLPLLPIIIIVMCSFSCLVYFKRDRVQSSCLFLGIGAVTSVILSLLTTFGILFLAGIPFSNLVAAVPFVVLGIGLDDAFIITGAFNRTDPALSTEVRMEQALSDCGLSIVLTTATTTAAVMLGMLTNVPAMRSFYIYAAPCIIIDFLYQIIFFIPLIVMDEKRKASKRCDCCPCFIGSITTSGDGTNTHSVQNSGLCQLVLEQYSNALEKSTVFKVSICALFLGWAISSAFFCSKLKVSFDFTDLISSESYVRSFITAVEEHSDLEVYTCTAFFRDVDFSLASTQNSINDYVDQLVNLTNRPPQYFWLHDFRNFSSQGNSSTRSLTFEKQLDMFLKEEMYKNLYERSIVRNNVTLEMTASAVVLSLDQIDINNSRQQTAFFSQQEDISVKSADDAEKYLIYTSKSDQKDTNRLPFFTFSEDYYMWAFYSIALDELVMTTFLSLITVIIITFFFVPNLYACLVVALCISMIYVDVLGIMHFSGLSINPVTLVSIIMSIGLLVDYVLHILLRCFESKDVEDEEAVLTDMASMQHKGVRECLETMGSSVLIGGISTALSTIPLLFSTSTIFSSICIIFLSFVTVSLIHGLVFVPALLSLFLRSETESEGDCDRPKRGNNASRDRNNTGETWDSVEPVNAEVITASAVLLRDVNTPVQ